MQDFGVGRGVGDLGFEAVAEAVGGIGWRGGWRRGDLDKSSWEEVR